MSSISLLYLPSAVLLGGLHALEPGHAKTLTAAYLIGTRGTSRDALLLGLSVAATHSVVVVAIAALGLYLGQEAFTDQATFWLQVGSGFAVIGLGSWMLWRRWPRAGTGMAHHHGHGHHEHDHMHGDHEHDHDHDHDCEHEHEQKQEHEHEHELELDWEDEHARAHAASLPDYVQRGERPTVLQIMAFGAAGGMIPCPASITVMLLALSIGKAHLGMLMVLGFSLGLAITLVGMGLLVVAGISKLASSGRLGWLSRRAPLISAAMVIASGLFALVIVA
ncbi:nickel/cobalt efflux transporter RcnA [Candidatus Poribacteria bacterium]|nr:nickel/cobalt efflux transporter RcnA [Candidatus Poribacteria bacterium]